MDCNKEEAIRAKEIAEKKMQCKDFITARFMALKAQQLFHELENISRMVSVCEIHCAAEMKIGGLEMDWYRILQVTLNADATTIKKQFRKLALSLHPDKNKFPGAEEAFKLIGEAQRVLLDSKMRSEHDLKRNAATKLVPGWKHNASSNNSFTRNQPNHHNNFVNTAYRSTTVEKKTVDAFWTVCPFCGIKYQYYRNVMNRSLSCRYCLKIFVAYDMNASGAHASVNSGFQQDQKYVPPKNNVSHQSFNSFSNGSNGSANAAPSRSHVNVEVGLGKEAGSGAVNQERTGPENKPGSGVGNKQRKNDDGNVVKHTTHVQTAKPSANVDGQQTAKASARGNKRGRKAEAESSESCDTGSSDDEETSPELGDYTSCLNTKLARSLPPRRSTRRKQQVAYKEDESDDFDDDNKGDDNDKDFNGEILNSETPKKSKLDGEEIQATENGATEKGAFWGSMKNDGQEDGIGGEQEQKKSEESNMHQEELEDSKDEDPVEQTHVDEWSFDTETAGEKYSYDDPDFFDFDQDRTEQRFKVNQIWAVYDDRDGMPREYVLIKKVVFSRFKVHFLWLEPCPSDKVEIDWQKSKLPISCGYFRLGSTGASECISIFSHLVSCSKNISPKSYKCRVYPKKGDIWAIFKDWDVKWCSDRENHDSYKYEVVEVLSDFDDNFGVEVVDLAKVKGFTSLFRRLSYASFSIPARELLRFSHKIPAFRLTGKEKISAPEGSVELDPASAPSELEEFGSEILNQVSPKRPKLDCDEKEAKLNVTIGEGRGLEGDSEVVCGEDIPTEHEKEQKNKECDVYNEMFEDCKAENPMGEIFKGQSTCYVETAAGDFSYADPEFYDFDKGRTDKDFQVNQIWALYDDRDGMPRFYARIDEVVQSGFKIHYTWLEPYPRRKLETKWIESGLPIACGAFVLGGTDNCVNGSSFSYLVSCHKSSVKKTYGIYPRKGDIWAIYKDWDFEWSSDPAKHETFEYEVVEVLSINDDNWGFEVVYLVKVKGFTSLFHRLSNRSFFIPFREVLRFSHKIPAYRATGKEGKSVPEGSIELDPAAAPSVLEEFRFPRCSD